MNDVTTKKEGALATVNFEADAAQGAQNMSQECECKIDLRQD